MLLLLIVAVIGFLIFRWAKIRNSGQEQSTDFYVGQLLENSNAFFSTLELRKKRYFFSQAERVFFVALLKATKDLPITVLSKVRLNDLLEATGDNKQANNNRINRMHVDFVLLSQPDFQPLLAIELDGPSHTSDRQQVRDTKKDAAFKAAGLPLKRFPNGVQPAQFAQILEPYLKIGAPQVAQQATVGRGSKLS